MADSSVTLPPTGSGTATPVFSTRTNLAGEHMEVVMVGIDGSDAAVGSDATNGLDVDVTRLPALPAGTNNIGDVDVLTLPALPAGTNNIGDVDVATVPAPLSTTGGGTEAAALRVTLANDSTGVVSVDDNGSTLSIDDGAGSITVDGTVSVSGAVDTELTTADLDTGAGADTRAVVGLVGAASGGGALIEGTAANGLEVDITRIAAGDTNIGNVDIVTVPAPLSTSGGGTEATALRVTVANDSTGVLSVDDNGSTLSVDDGAGSLTVDGAVTANAGTGTFTVGATDFDIRNLDVAQDDVRIGGMAASDVAVADNPVAVGGRASTAVPTAVSTAGDAVWAWADLFGRQLVQQGVPIGTEVTKTAQYTTAQTGVALWTPAAGKKVVVTYVQIQVGGTTAGTVQLWFGGSADTTYTRGTDRAIFDGEFAPSATLKPGFTATKESGWAAAANDDILRVTTSAAINPITFSVWGYEV